MKKLYLSSTSPRRKELLETREIKKDKVLMRQIAKSRKFFSRGGKGKSHRDLNWSRLYLASTSPRRRELLKSLNIPFEVIPPEFDEKPTELPPREECLYFAEQKALSVRDRCPDALVLGCDTLVELEGKKLGKPADAEEARIMLHALSEKAHHVHSAAVLLNTATGEARRAVDTAAVTFRALSDEDIASYIVSGEPMGKAGAYAIQGQGRKLVARFEGDENTVIGLPVRIIREWLLTIGLKC